MQDANRRIEELAHKWLNGSITPEEKAEFMTWYNSQDNGEPLIIPEEFAADDLTHGMRMYKNIYEKIKLLDENDRPAPVRRITKWVAFAAAAVILIVFASYFFYTLDAPIRKPNVSEPVVVHNDVTPPSSSHAVITLGDGSHINLDSVQNGQITTQGKVKITRLSDGRIVYKGTSNEITYNTISNPRGSKVLQLTLADGTKVWLNSESSLRYPTAFAGADRAVEVTGETYFEVSRLPGKPFKVRKGSLEITVLGTHFNVNTYEEEGNMKVTLLEGSVNVSKVGDTKKIRLEPGEQSQLNKNGDLTVARDVNTEDITAWKNGKFQFGEKANIGTVMREIARWYDLQLEYDGTINLHFGGSISREVNLSQVLKVIEATGGVKFKIAGNKVTIMP